MNAREAYEVVTAYVDDASSFAELFDSTDLGDLDRPIAREGYPIDEALKVLGDLVPWGGEPDAS